MFKNCFVIYGLCQMVSFASIASDDYQKEDLRELRRVIRNLREIGKLQDHQLDRLKDEVDKINVAFFMDMERAYLEANESDKPAEGQIQLCNADNQIAIDLLSRMSELSFGSWLSNQELMDDLSQVNHKIDHDDSESSESKHQEFVEAEYFRVFYLHYLTALNRHMSYEKSIDICQEISAVYREEGIKNKHMYYFKPVCANNKRLLASMMKVLQDVFEYGFLSCDIDYHFVEENLFEEERYQAELGRVQKHIMVLLNRLQRNLERHIRFLKEQRSTKFTYLDIDKYEVFDGIWEKAWPESSNPLAIKEFFKEHYGETRSKYPNMPGNTIAIISLIWVVNGYIDVLHKEQINENYAFLQMLVLQEQLSRISKNSCATASCSLVVSTK